MSGQVQAILWAQFRTVRNYLPRTSLGAALVWLLGAAWYGLFVAIAAGLAASLPHIPLKDLPRSVGLILFFLLLFWQIFPLMTLSSGWSLDVRRLLVYPIRERTLFAIEVLLRITTAPETLIMLAGIIVGLMRHPHVPALCPLFLLLYLPFNLFLSLAIRETLLRFFQRRRFKELFAVFFLAIMLSPTLLANTSLGRRLAPVAFRLASSGGTPWFEVSSLSLGRFSFLSIAIFLLWTLAAYLFAARQFANGLRQDRSGFGASIPRKKKNQATAPKKEVFFGSIGYLFRDPTAALIEKEFRTLLRSPRFRVMFGMACVFSVIVFLPFTSGRLASQGMAQNYLPAVSTYGLVLLGEVLLWNAFGFDRKAAQLYFVAPIRFSTVLRAKNTVAVVLILLMSVLITAVGFLFRLRVTLVSMLASLALTAVLAVFFLAFGNLTSVLLPRPIDPNQAMRKQNSGQTSLWFLLALVVLAVPIGLAFAARWAFNAEWAFFAVLAVDFVIALVVYHVATESAIARAERDRERILDALGKGADPIES
jgi:ABC-2 type transport system permease protein